MVSSHSSEHSECRTRLPSPGTSVKSGSHSISPAECHRVKSETLPISALGHLAHFTAFLASAKPVSDCCVLARRNYLVRYVLLFHALVLCGHASWLPPPTRTIARQPRVQRRAPRLECQKFALQRRSTYSTCVCAPMVRQWRATIASDRYSATLVQGTYRSQCS